MATPATPTTSVATISPKSTPGAPSQKLMNMKCKCGMPANRLRVKKEGPTQGRHFYKCPQQVCEYFEWDPVDMEMLRTGAENPPEVSPEVTRQLEEEMEHTKQELLRREDSLRMREDSVLQMQTSLHEGAKQLVETVVEQAEQRHQEMMGSQQAHYQGQMEQMQNHLIWHTALAGERSHAGSGKEPRGDGTGNGVAPEDGGRVRELRRKARCLRRGRSHRGKHSSPESCSGLEQMADRIKCNQHGCLAPEVLLATISLMPCHKEALPAETFSG